jgi:hypothetical protein
VQPFIKDHLASHRIVANHHRLGIIEQDLARHPAKVPEGRLQALEPRRLPFVPKRRHETAARVAQRRHEQVNPQHLAADRHKGRAKVDLQLPAGRRLEAHARPRLGK